MERIKVYFCEISDSNNQKHQIKTEKYDEILKFMRIHRGVICGINMGSRVISKEKFEKLKTE